MKYKRIANYTLLVLFFSFITLSIVKYFLYPNSMVVKGIVFVLEAALVGGIADWFAITALFQHPLGIPIPHTALIPNNRKKVITSIVHLVENELLEKESLKKQIEKIPLIEIAISYVDKYYSEIENFIITFCIKQLHFLSQHNQIKKTEQLIKEIMNKFPLSTFLENSLIFMLENENKEKLYNFIIDELIIQIENSTFKEKIYAYLTMKKNEQFQHTSKMENFFKRILVTVAEQTNTLNLEDATNLIYEEILNEINQMKKNNHPLRKQLENKLIEIKEEIHSNIEWQNNINNWKNHLVEDIHLQPIIQQVITSITESTTFYHWFQQQLQLVWENFKENQIFQRQLDTYLKVACIDLISTQHHLIGNIVNDVLNNFSDDDLILFIEEKVGEDLQWIRLNGSIIGGIVGGILFLFLHGIYDPILQLFK